jgi:hypothetical protein
MARKGKGGRRPGPGDRPGPGGKGGGGEDEGTQGQEGQEGAEESTAKKEGTSSPEPDTDPTPNESPEGTATPEGKPEKTQKEKDRARVRKGTFTLPGQAGSKSRRTKKFAQNRNVGGPLYKPGKGTAGAVLTGLEAAFRGGKGQGGQYERALELNQNRNIVSGLRGAFQGRRDRSKRAAGAVGSDALRRFKKA